MLLCYCDVVCVIVAMLLCGGQVARRVWLRTERVVQLGPDVSRQSWTVLRL